MQQYTRKSGLIHENQKKACIRLFTANVYSPSRGVYICLQCKEDLNYFQVIFNVPGDQSPLVKNVLTIVVTILTKKIARTLKKKIARTLKIT